MQVDADLFDFAARQRAATKARTEHPETSKAAARDLVTSGRLGRAMLKALAIVRDHPGLTASELDSIAATAHPGHKDGAVRKRLAELRAGGYLHNGDPRTCRVTGKAALTWGPSIRTRRD